MQELSVTENDNNELLRNQIIHLQEELKIYKDDLTKKDELIKELSSMEIPKHDSPSSQIVEVQAELFGSKMNLDCANKRIEEKESELIEKVRELECLKKENNELMNRIEEITIRLSGKENESEEQCKEKEELRNSIQRSQLAIEKLQIELQQSVDSKVALELRLKEYEDRFGSSEKDKETLAHKIETFYYELTSFLNLESDTEPWGVLEKIKLLTAENDKNRGEILKLKFTLEQREDCYLKTRESLKNLVTKDNTSSVENYIKEKKEISFELEKVNLEKKQMELKVTDLEMKLEESNKMLEDLRKELDEKMGQLSKVDLEQRDTKYKVNNIGRDYDMFRESLSNILGNALKYCDASEDSIKDRVRKLVIEMREKSNTITMLEEKLRNISMQYEKNFENAKESDYKARRVEMEYLDMRDRIKLLENEVAARDLCRDELRAEKDRFLHFLKKLTSLLKMDPYIRETDVSLIFDGVINRVDQLAIAENSCNVDTNRTIQNLKKRLRETKDQLHSRDLHLEMMRKKIAQQDESIKDVMQEAEKSRGMMECEEENKTKMMKMQRKVDTLRDENKALKSEIFELSEFKYKYEAQLKDMETAKHNVEKLERIRQRQAEKIGQLTKNVELCDNETNQTKIVSENAVQTLTKELRTMRSAMERAKRSEKELLDFRVVIGKILGLDVRTLAIPSYEIIRRLERLVQSNGSFVVAAPVHQQSYEDSRIFSRSRRAPLRTGGCHEHGRPRSVSPEQSYNNVDPRKY